MLFIPEEVLEQLADFMWVYSYYYYYYEGGNIWTFLGKYLIVILLLLLFNQYMERNL